MATLFVHAVQDADPAALADELGYVPLYLRYNSGLRIADNGRALAGLLHELLEHWPEPVQELVIVGHSMGGLVARSAVHEAQQAGHAWPQRLGKLVFLGTPHHGAPLERGGHGLDYLLELSR
jgi:triacylglycerol esterase/lipase EstA (alpha/beta hydrolase family)